MARIKLREWGTIRGCRRPIPFFWVQDGSEMHFVFYPAVSYILGVVLAERLGSEEAVNDALHAFSVHQIEAGIRSGAYRLAGQNDSIGYELRDEDQEMLAVLYSGA